MNQTHRSDAHRRRHVDDSSCKQKTKQDKKDLLVFTSPTSSSLVAKRNPSKFLCFIYSVTARCEQIAVRIPECPESERQARCTQSHPQLEKRIQFNILENRRRVLHLWSRLMSVDRGIRTELKDRTIKQSFEVTSPLFATRVDNALCVMMHTALT